MFVISLLLSPLEVQVMICGSCSFYIHLQLYDFGFSTKSWRPQHSFVDFELI